MIVTKEKRSYQRREVFRHVTYEASSPAQKTNAIDAEIQNISTGGACIVTGKAQNPGSVVMLMRPLKHINLMVPSLAEVMWAVRVDGEFRLGLQFIPGRIKMR
jgi:c-di-GMP-binding flagellar brake protein YcgR